MTRYTGKKWLAAATLSSALIAMPAVSHFDEDEMQQSYRQSFFALVAMNFGPMVAAVKGEIPWDQARMESWANDLATLSTLDIMRGFAEGSDKGTTRAKPEIWENMEDFTSKMETLDKELITLQEITAEGDRAEIAAQIGMAGKACKACHDEYKAENYLY